MRFWDSSAIVPLLVSELSTDELTRAFETDPDMLVWWAGSVECVSAISRREREGVLADAAATAALDRLSALELGWTEIQPVERVRAVAIRMLRVHSLRAADALQLGAAVIAAEGHPASLPFVTLDEQLSCAARREGFRVVSADA